MVINVNGLVSESINAFPLLVQQWCRTIMINIDVPKLDRDFDNFRAFPDVRYLGTCEIAKEIKWKFLNTLPVSFVVDSPQ